MATNPEYMIRPVAGPAWVPVPADRVAEVLEPRGYGSIAVQGPGDLRLVLGGCEMVFSGEDVGWQVWFEGEIVGHDLDALVGQVAAQLTEFAGEPMTWVRYG